MDTKIDDINDDIEVWRCQKAKLKHLFSHLDESDFYYEYGKKNVMITNLHQKIGKTREEFDAFILTLAKH